MAYIESFIQEYICNLWGYWLFVFVGLYFKYENLQYTFLPSNHKIYKIAVDIGVVIFLSYSITMVNEDQISSTSFDIFVIIVLLIYCFYTLNSKCDNGTTESLLVIINGIYVTYLSFTSWPISLFISAIIIIISYLISKYRHFDNMSEFWEIILLSGEAVLISAVVFFFGLNSFYHTVLIVLFTETTLTLLNVLLIYGIKKLCGENAEEYLYRVKGVDSL